MGGERLLRWGGGSIGGERSGGKDPPHTFPPLRHLSFSTSTPLASCGCSSVSAALALLVRLCLSMRMVSGDVRASLYHPVCVCVCVCVCVPVSSLETCELPSTIHNTKAIEALEARVTSLSAKEKRQEHTHQNTPKCQEKRKEHTHTHTHTHQDNPKCQEKRLVTRREWPQGLVLYQCL
jgi:hypothetical protein